MTIYDKISETEGSAYSDWNVNADSLKKWQAYKMFSIYEFIHPKAVVL